MSCPCGRDCYQLINEEEPREIFYRPELNPNPTQRKCHYKDRCFRPDEHYPRHICIEYNSATCGCRKTICPTGSTGDTGPAGPQGVTGPTGDTGPQGTA